MSELISVKDKFLGCFLGGAVGDAIGKPYEFVPRSITRGQILFNSPYLPQPQFTHPLDKLPYGSYTDDTFLNIYLLEHFTSHVPSDTVPNREVRQALANWHCFCEKKRDQLRSELDLESDEVDRYATRFAGITTTTAAKCYHESISRKSAAARSESCGPLTRLAPLVLGRGMPDDPMSVGQFYALETHDSPQTSIATGIVGVLIEFMFSRVRFKFNELDKVIRNAIVDIPENYGVVANKGLSDKQRAYKDAQEVLSNRYNQMRENLRNGAFELALTSGSTSHAFDVLLSAIAILFLSKGDFEETARLSKYIGGDADSISSLACSLSGLLRGWREISGTYRKMLDDTLQPSFDELVQLIKKFYQKVAKENPKFVSQHFTEPNNDLDDVTRDILQELSNRKRGFLSHGEAVRFGCGPYFLAIQHFDDRDDIIVSESGLLSISNPIVLDEHPLCLVQQINRLKAETTQRGNPKLLCLIRLIARQLNVKDKNTLWRFENLLELIGTREATLALKKSSPLGASKAHTLRLNAILDKVHDIVSRIRDPASVPEKAFRDSVFLITSESVANLRKRAEHLHPNPCRPAVQNLQQLTQVGWRGGCFVISVDRKVAGPLQATESQLVDTSHKPFEMLPVPASELIYSRLTSTVQCDAVCVYPRRNAICVLNAGRVVCLTRNATEPQSLRLDNLGQHQRQCTDRWMRVQAVAKELNQKVVYLAVSFVLDTVLHTDHGCSICVVKSVKDFFGEKAEDKWLNKPIALSKVKTWHDLGTIRDFLTEDGAVVLDSSGACLVAYGQRFNPERKSWQKVAPVVTTTLTKESRGMRHLFGAVYAAQLGKRGIVVVGSERGDVTVFGENEMVSILSK